MPSEGLGGLAATQQVVVVGCRDAANLQDIWLCLDAQSGLELWSHAYPAEGELDFGESPRATPLVYRDRVFLQGAFGDLHGVKLATGELVWQRNIVADFGAELPTWGVCGSPLVVDGKLIVQPGAAGASIVALDPLTGQLQWKTPGRPSGYSSLLAAELGGKRQIVGYDKTTLGGWDPDTGKRLWEVRGEEEGDFNVPTPVIVAGKLFVATENNGGRLYQFDATGRIDSKPSAVFPDLTPDMHSPVAIGSSVYGIHQEMVSLDARKKLKVNWRGQDDSFLDFTAVIGGARRLLVTTVEGELLLVDATPDRFRVLSRLMLGDGESQVYSHPALVGRRFYIRIGNTVGRLTL